MRIQSLDKQFIEYTYIENRNHNAIADRFVRNTTIALDFLVRTSVLTISFKEDDILQRFDVIDILVADTTNNITIVPSNKNAYSPKYNTILFYDTHGVVFRKNHKKRWFRSNKGYNSPVSLLAHELIHCYNELYDTEDYLNRKQDFTSRGKKIDQDGNDLSFPNAEEVFVIKMTNQVAARLGEDRRSNYGRSYYPTRHVLTTKKAKKLF
ncbi:hypothetical protein C7H62_0997 [Mesoflavibacter sp. HG96]|uniref:hypothetical protein n=1 Tax=unclassified Mesoflavibacter TaxID=2630131 RepID=UPI000D0F0EA5|nr:MULTISPECIES: hypothetical protein [unclassified Mesoflavibacter]QIJ88806.1 hypothetical protein C7H62_0997 [Mesoflavibacter sp. HG96]QIJ91534.1 hypothetical protein C7H56_0997 [Mesoflavibacter sp. HG37]